MLSMLLLSFVAIVDASVEIPPDNKLCSNQQENPATGEYLSYVFQPFLMTWSQALRTYPQINPNYRLAVIKDEWEWGVAVDMLNCAFVPDGAPNAQIGYYNGGWMGLSSHDGPTQGKAP